MQNFEIRHEISVSQLGNFKETLEVFNHEGKKSPGWGNVLLCG